MRGRSVRHALLGLAGSLFLVPLAFAQPSRGDAGRGVALYRERCTLCHGGQGEGWDWSKKVEKPPVPVPDLAQVAPERSDQYLFDVVKEGGEAVGKTRFMPPFGFQLTDEQVWDLVAYMRSLAKRAP
jgi:cytochrome c oxidase cbb3-type subunit 3